MVSFFLALFFLVDLRIYIEDGRRVVRCRP